MKNASILVIDSDVDFRLRIKRALSNAGFEHVKVSESISSTVKSTDFAGIDIIVSDWNLFSMGKETLIHELQRRNTGKTVPIIALGSNITDAVSAGRNQEQLSDYVLKSTAPTLLASRIMEILKRPVSNTADE